VAPASIVNVTPLFTRMFPVNAYGPFALVHVVSELIMPLTLEACTVPKCPVSTKANPPTKITIINIA
jgi:hypothetical protein